MRHVLLHDTIDTPLHTPAHTQLFEHTPPYNRLWALAFKKGTDDQHFHFRLSSGGQHRHREGSPQAKQLPRTPPYFWWRLLNITCTVWKTTITDDCDTRLGSCKMSSTTITITKFNGTNYAQWATMMALLLEQKQVWYHQRIRWHAGRASSKRDRYREGRFQRLEESPWCCQIDYPAQHGAEDTSGIDGRRGCKDALGEASISLQVKAKAQHLRD